MTAEVTVVIVSYNTRELTLRAVETLLENAGDVAMQVIVWDNASADGSADAIRARFPDVEVVASPDNLGFARANNAAIKQVETEWVVLLNPDTETHPDAIANLLRFARNNPQAGIVGGRTVFPDGSLNIASCWNRMTLWSLFCRAFGLARMFPGSSLFNSEAIGGWKRDSVRHVDIVSGCFLMTRSALWRELGGFNEKYFMYAEEADLCLRAGQAGYRPMITSGAEIMHLVGASGASSSRRLIQMLTGKTTLMRDHWPGWKIRIGQYLHLQWVYVKMIGERLRRNGSSGERVWAEVWRERRQWLKGY